MQTIVLVNEPQLNKNVEFVTKNRSFMLVLIAHYTISNNIILCALLELHGVQ